MFTKRDSVGRKSGQPIAGFFVAGDWYYDGDPSPSAIVTWKAKDDKLAEIQAAPLKDINSQASLSAGVFQRDEGKELNVRGPVLAGVASREI